MPETKKCNNSTKIEEVQGTDSEDEIIFGQYCIAFTNKLNPIYVLFFFITIIIISTSELIPSVLSVSHHLICQTTNCNTSLRSKHIPGRQRVAICFTGNVRSFNLEFVHDSLLRNLIYPVEQDYNVDIFFNVKFKEPSSAPYRDIKDADANQFYSIMSKKFQPVVVHKLKDDDPFIPVNTTFSDDDINILKKPDYCDGYATVYTPYSLFRYSQCPSLIAKHERKKRVSYDYIYALRPDLWMNETFTTPGQMKPNTIYVNMAPKEVITEFRKTWRELHPNDSRVIPSSSDQLIGGRRDEMLMALRGAVETIDHCETYAFYRSLNPESLLSLWSLMNGLKIHSDPLFMSIFRRATGIGCPQYQSFEFFSEKRKQKIIKQCYKYNDYYKSEIVNAQVNE